MISFNPSTTHPCEPWPYCFKMQKPIPFDIPIPMPTFPGQAPPTAPPTWAPGVPAVPSFGGGKLNTGFVVMLTAIILIIVAVAAIRGMEQVGAVKIRGRGTANA